MWFESWSEISGGLAVGTAVYLSLLVPLRVSGRRTLATLDASGRVVAGAAGWVGASDASPTGRSR